MVVILLATALIVGIAYIQVVQGVFSALIMTILSVLSAAIAFTYYEPLAQTFFYNRFSAYADGTCLIALFVLSLLVLRLLADRFIPANVVLNVWPNRIIGGIFGLISGVICVGVLAVSLQMLPWGPSMMTYRPFDDSLQRVQSLAPLYPDDFAVGLAKTLSSGGLSGRRSFGEVHPDLLLELYCARNTAGSLGRVDTPRDGLQSVTVYEPAGQAIPGISPTEIPVSPFLPEDAIDKVIVVKTVLAASVANEKDKWYRLPATHFRLLTDKYKGHYPLAYLLYGQKDEKGTPLASGWQLIAAPYEEDRLQIGKLIVQRPGKKQGKTLAVDWVYRIGKDEKPIQLIFRRTAKVRIQKVIKGFPSAEVAKAALYKLVKTGRRRRR